MARQAKVLAGGISFGEGPRWHEGRLWFSDFYDHAVKSVSEAGDVRVEFEIDDQPSGLGWTPDGELLVVSMTKRLLLRRSADGRISTLADLSGVATWHCNDMVVDAAGRAYVGNFGFDLEAAAAQGGLEGVSTSQPPAKLARVDPDGGVHVAAEDMHFPNGTVITPDGRRMIIGETFAGRLTAFDIGPDGAFSNRRVWAEIAPRLPDGICLDAAGCVWVANPTAPECVRVAEGGEVVDVIQTAMPCFACMLGGADGRTLFMMTSRADEAGGKPKGQVESVRVDVAHAGRP
ncbi:MAG: SMP-30/gluconolactonase/LRE family protein [Alphaproteobacteria bacterium]|nr:SMP-30/gluconolactonase/LRE family protein [Alphaproteobacteria bacterium]